MEQHFDQEFFDIEQILNEGPFRYISDEEFMDYDADADSSEEEQDNNSEEDEVPQQQATSRHQLTVQTKRKMVDDILLNMHAGELKRGFLSDMGRRYGVHRSTTLRLWKFVKQSIAEGNVIDVRSKKLGKTGPKPKEITDEFLQSVPLYKRTTERSYASALKISHSFLHKLKKKGRLRTHTVANHPALTSNHKVARLKWALEHIHPIPAVGNPTFMDMQQHIHIDEKWFYMNPETRRFYLLPKEENPYRCQQSKRYKVKAMFMGVIGKPLYDCNGQMLHDGKFGIFPFTYQQRAKKKSKNRDAGVMETKVVESVNKEEIRKMLLQNIIPAIKRQWHPSLPKDIFIQWDNARPHQIPMDEEFIAACTSDGFNIQMVFQPAQSPDLNVLDLGLFKVIQSLQYQSFPTTLDELIDKVYEAYEWFDPILNKYTWITLQGVMMKILEKEGGNNFNPPHMGKQRLEALGLLPTILECDRGLIQQAVAYLNTFFIPVNQDFPDQTQNEVDAD
ncbi:uncharacterized protein LOC110714841 [Chenopodium quinoa]|uniref:uncharacterized protein LOC110714841 n=1 Tax=Chenopodium quinoa TaxID=63459 RepID=UPI000B7818E6|nr:uncharacterized protein LOC110714841 [Chenopodium quinoa]